MGKRKDKDDTKIQGVGRNDGPAFPIAYLEFWINFRPFENGPEEMVLRFEKGHLTRKLTRIVCGILRTQIYRLVCFGKHNAAIALCGVEQAQFM